MQIFNGTSCATKTYLACNDDYAAGSSNSAILKQITGGAGVYLYIQIMGYYEEQANGFGYFSVYGTIT
jgi:hypothetical protein